MKKLWIILLATLLAFGFGVISCGDGSVPDYSAPAAPGGGDEGGGYKWVEVTSVTDYAAGDGDTAGTNDSQIKITIAGANIGKGFEFETATKVKLEVANAVGGGVTFIVQAGGSPGLGWVSKQVINNDGDAPEGTFAELSEDKKTITVDIAGALGVTDFASYKAMAEWGALIFAYYTGDTKARGLGAFKTYIYVPE
jgi:hypothetical protein